MLNVIGRRALVLLVAILVVQSGAIVHAQTPPPAEPAAAAAVDDAAPAETKPRSEEDAARKRKLRLAIITGGLIAVTGLAMVAFTILGGSATRRGLRRKPLIQPPPPQEPIPAERFDEVEPAAESAEPDLPGETKS